MEARPKSKRAVPPVRDPDAPDSLVSALANELLARENLNLIFPLTVFTAAVTFLASELGAYLVPPA